MTERNCCKGVVYVVETAMGAIKTYVVLSSKGKNFIPCEDTYNDEQSVMYTIMVILEKEGLPAGAGGMCGPIMASTIDVLVDSYDLQPMLVREYEESETILEVVDTVSAK